MVEIGVGIASFPTTLGLGSVPGFGMIALGVDQIMTGTANLATGTQGPSVFEFGGSSAARGVGFDEATAQTIGQWAPAALSLGLALAPTGAGGLTLPSIAPRALAATEGQINTLFVRLLELANSPEFLTRARALGYTEAEIGLLTDRIWNYWQQGQIGLMRTGGWASQDLLMIGQRGTYSLAGRMRHELGHVLDEIARPGLMAASQNARTFGWTGYFGAEWVAYGTQFSNPFALYVSRPWVTGFTASTSRFGMLGLLGWSGGTLAVGYGVEQVSFPVLDKIFDKLIGIR